MDILNVLLLAPPFITSGGGDGGGTSPLTGMPLWQQAHEKSAKRKRKLRKEEDELIALGLIGR